MAITHFPSTAAGLLDRMTTTGSNAGFWTKASTCSAHAWRAGARVTWCVHPRNAGWGAQGSVACGITCASA